MRLTQDDHAHIDKRSLCGPAVGMQQCKQPSCKDASSAFDMANLQLTLFALNLEQTVKSYHHFSK